MNKIKTVKINNFMSVDDLTIDFSTLGLCLVRGSNGSGKSNIFRKSIEYLFFGRVPENIRSDEFLPDFDPNNLSVVGELEIDDTEYVIERYRNHLKHGNSLVVYQNGKNISKTDNRKTQQLLNNILGVDYETFESSTCFNTNSTLFAESTSADRTKLLSKILRISKWDERLDKTKKDLKELYSKRDELSSLLTSYQYSLKSDEETLKSMKSDTKSQEDFINESIEGLERNKADLEFIIKKAKPIAKSLPNLENKREELYDKLQNAIKATQSRQRETLSYETEVKGYKRALGLSGTCPTCKQEVDSTHKITIENDLEEAETKLKESLSKEETLKKEEQSLADSLSSLESKIAESNEVINKAKEASLELSHVKEEIAKFQERKNSIYKVYQEVEERVKSTKKELKSTKKELNSIENDCKYMEFWVKGFSRQGIPNLEIEKNLTRISERVNSYLSGTGISVSLSAQKDVKSTKTKKEEIDIVIFNNGKKRSYNNLSAGERRRIDIAFLFSIIDISTNRFNIEILDELLDGALDSDGSDLVVSILQQRAKNVDSLLVISHQVNLQDQFDNSFSIRNTGGKSRINE